MTHSEHFIHEILLLPGVNKCNMVEICRQTFSGILWPTVHKVSHVFLFRSCLRNYNTEQYSLVTTSTNTVNQKIYIHLQSNEIGFVYNIFELALGGGRIDFFLSNVH